MFYESIYKFNLHYYSTFSQKAQCFFGEFDCLKCRILSLYFVHIAEMDCRIDIIDLFAVTELVKRRRSYAKKRRKYL